MKNLNLVFISIVSLSIASCGQSGANYPIVDTEQSKCFDSSNVISAPSEGEAFYGQDAQHQGIKPSYTDNGDGTITDNVTGLVWQKAYAVMSYSEAMAAAESFTLAGHSDWRVPSIKEAYSLMMFSGVDANVPFVDTSYFDFEYAANGVRPIDSQMLSSTLYVGTSGAQGLAFGVNFADGRIKGYGLTLGSQDKPFMVRFVRGDVYGINDFADNGDGTISDKATSLMWSKTDCQEAMNWEDALAYAQEMNESNYLGYSDWRVPNVKELQSLVDYTRSPQTSSSAAIDPMFEASTITDEAGELDYPFYWSSTTHENSSATPGNAGAYVAFGRSLGNMSNSQGMGMMMPSEGQMGERQQGERGERQQGEMGDRQQGERGERPEGQMGERQQGERGERQQGEMGDRQQGERGERPEGQMGERQQGERGERPEGQMGEHQHGEGEQATATDGQNWIDVHGAGSQRSDPKSGDASVFADGNGPQGDAIRILNYVRLVRDL